MEILAICDFFGFSDYQHQSVDFRGFRPTTASSSSSRKTVNLDVNGSTASLSAVHPESIQKLSTKRQWICPKGARQSLERVVASGAG